MQPTSDEPIPPHQSVQQPAVPDPIPDYSTPVPQPSPLKDGLPSGWETQIDKLGCQYYIDHNTQRTTWNRPPAQTTEALAPNTTTSHQPLPAGWEERLAPNGNTYFVDHNTHTTTWIHPLRIPAWATVAARGPLPSGWEMRLTGTSRLYFVNHHTCTTTWSDPRPTSRRDESQAAESER